jgi:nucleotide-binding universal stress UspA family protein
MNELHAGLPFADSILHPTDFSEESGRAFDHALALALRQKGRLTILNAGGGERGERWMEFPSVRATLVRWGLLEKRKDGGSISRDIDVHVKKVSLKRRHPLAAVLDYVEKHPVDLIVLATEGREGLPRWLRPSLAEAIARRSETMTLFVPGAARSFVSDDTGRVSLGCVVVPVDRRPAPHAAVVQTARVASMSASTPVQSVVFHAGTSESLPDVRCPDYAFCRWSTVTRPGDVVEGILGLANERSADLIVMATAGHDGFLDALRGSVTEQVVRRAPCPVLAVPARTVLL